MTWKSVADFVVGVHTLWVIVVIIGPLPSWRWPRFRWIHLVMMLSTILIMISGRYCPLTSFENWLRAHHDPATAYAGGFIATYLEKLLYADISPNIIFWALVAWAILWGFLYFQVWPKRKKL